MIRKIYLDTSVISALFDDRTPDRQKLTEESFKKFEEYEVFVSELVIEELNAASQKLKEKFLNTVDKYEVLKTDKESKKLANKYVEEGIFPEKYYDDSLHVAIATVNELDYLLSWNFKHLVKVKTRKLVSLVNIKNDYNEIEIIVPPEL